MLKRTTFGRVLDKLVLSAVLFFACSAIFASTTRNLLLGMALAAPVTLLFFYALRLWQRRAVGTETLARNARYHLQNLMLFSETKALSFLIPLLPHFNIENASLKRGRLTGIHEGQSADIFILRKPLDSHADSHDVLRCYHRTSALRCLIVSTAPFDEQASVFAKLRTNPSVLLVGPPELLPLLKDIPAGDAPKNEEREKKRVLLSRIKERALEPRRRNHCLLYGILMLVAYILWSAPTFLFPGLVCIFLAVLSKGEEERKKASKMHPNR